MQFTKMHGAGNDYVYVSAFTERLPGDLPELARQMADRHFGVGGDGLVVIAPSERADARMRMFNLDGSESELQGQIPELREALEPDALQVDVPTARRDVDALWRWREGIPLAVATLRGGKVSEDIVVPLDRLGEAVERTIEIGARTIWMQEGIVNLEAAERARAAGLTVVMDRCMRATWRRLLGPT